MRYLLTFKPLKNFFFGNSKTFSDDNLAISEYFPQNTQLLGAIRLFIAEQKGLMRVYTNGKWCDKPNELKSLTGSATSKDFMSNKDLGKIENLSQMFIVTKNIDDAYFPTPFDLKITKDSVEYYELKKIDDKNYYLQNYDAKSASKQHLGGGNFWNNYIEKKDISLNSLKSFEDVFEQHSQVGIELDNKQTVKEKFYSKIDYNLKDDYLFACMLDFDDVIEDAIIQIGAESSMFNLQVHKLEDTSLINHLIVTKLFTQPVQSDKVVALSDVMLSNSNEFDSYFNIIPFYKNFAMLNKTKSKFNSKTKQKRVVPTRSVFYLKDTKLPKSNIGAYAKMGYNQFISVKK